jgi:hypothetical protein
MYSRSASTGPAKPLICSTGTPAESATACVDSPRRMRVWMSRGLRELSMRISNWPEVFPGRDGMPIREERR